MTTELLPGTIEQRLEFNSITGFNSCANMGCSPLRQIKCRAIFAATALLIWLNPKCKAETDNLVEENLLLKGDEDV
jgi:hypothetical protein